MFHDLRAIDLQHLLAARPDGREPLVVVGSGAAGIALAEGLAAGGRDVVVLESGAEDAGSAAGDLNEGASDGVRFRLREGRERRFGGTTDRWHGQCTRLHPHDLAPRPWVEQDLVANGLTDHATGWPMTPEELTPWYDDAERWLGVSGRGYGPQRWDERPDLPPVAWDPDRLIHDFTEYTPDPHLARRHRGLLARDPRVTVVVNATVTRIRVRTAVDGAVRVHGLQVAAPDGGRHTVEVGQVVLAAGGLENARLLQLSDDAGVGLGTGRRHTGAFLQDHPVIRTAEVIPHDHRVLQDRYVLLHRGRERLFPKVALAPAAQRREGLLDATAILVHDHDDPALDAARRLVLAARARRRPERPLHDAWVASRAPRPVVRDAYRRYVRGLASGARPAHVWLQVWVEQAPRADRRVVLDTATDRLGEPRTRVHWDVTEQEMRSSRVLTRWIADDLERLGLATVRDLPPMTDDTAWREAVVDAFHPAGTTRMSRDPVSGVVDPDLRVHGVEGLHVVGGSVFPTSGYANPTLTIVALALRLAHHLSAEVSTAPSVVRR